MASVLIIDDDTDSRDALARFLTKAGHAVRCASNGAEALAALSQAVPEAVVLDVRMPGMDGIAVLGVMRSYLRWAAVPVAVFTAYPDDPRLWHVDQAGVTRVFAKGKHHPGDVLEWIELLGGRDPNSGGGGPGCRQPHYPC